jgi:hypothetical protein
MAASLFALSNLCASPRAHTNVHTTDELPEIRTVHNEANMCSVGCTFRLPAAATDALDCSSTAGFNLQVTLDKADADAAEICAVLHSRGRVQASESQWSTELMYDKLVQEPLPPASTEIRSAVWSLDMIDSSQRNADLYESSLCVWGRCVKLLREQGCQLLLYVIRDTNTNTLQLRGRVLNVTALRQRITEQFTR